MVHMMELPMVTVVAQRFGRSAGSATVGARGDLALIAGIVSGGHALPVLSPTDLKDCWSLAGLALHTAIRLRSPVRLLASKEIVMTLHYLDLTELEPISSVRQSSTEDAELPGSGVVPSFRPVGNHEHQVRLSASTHDREGNHQSLAPEALTNTNRLHERAIALLPTYLRYELDEQPGARMLVVAWDVTALAARQAVQQLHANGRRVSLLPKTLIRFLAAMVDMTSCYERVVIAEENLTGQLRQLMFGVAGRPGLHGVNAVGLLVSPDDILRQVEVTDG